MFNSRLVTAAALSLGFHAVLLAVIGLTAGTGSEPPAGPGGHPATLVRLTMGSSQETGELPETLPGVAPVPAATPAAEPAAETREKAAEVSGSTGMGAADVDSGRADGPAIAVSSGDAGGGGDTGIADAAAESGASGNPALPENTEPSLVTAINPVYPVLARRLGVEGVVILDVVIDSSGVPVECIIVPPRVHKVLEESALTAVKQARFQPGMEGGRPIQDTYRLKVRFELEA